MNTNELMLCEVDSGFKGRDPSENCFELKPFELLNITDQVEHEFY